MVVGGAVVDVVVGAAVVVVLLVVLSAEDELLLGCTVGDAATAAVLWGVLLLSEPIAAPIAPSATTATAAHATTCSGSGLARNRCQALRFGPDGAGVGSVGEVAGGI
ncbi:MAG TPA: hypothetical protein VGJ03_05420 [Acidimicrobiales bacterium]